MSEYKLLSKDVEGVDLFEGKAQENLANVIKENIFNENFRLIGIEGPWGVGKSNLVELLKKKMSSDAEMFIYDVWGHQTDDYRRSFLLELIEFLEQSSLINDEKLIKWKDESRKVFAHRRESKTAVSIKLSDGFLVGVVVLFFLEILSVFKNEVLAFLLSSITFPIRVLLGLALLTCLIALVVNKIKGVKNLWLDNYRAWISRLFQFVRGEHGDQDVTEFIYEEKTSVMGFKKCIAEIAKDLDKKKLIIVFDNIDRVPSEQVMIFWSNIHVFFALNKIENIAVILPFDRDRVKKSLLKNFDNNDTANEFVNKTFDVVLRVSPPIVSNWKIYFKLKWQEAVEGCPDDEFEHIIHAFEMSKDSIRPRDIIVFINEIVLSAQVNLEVPERYIALFILFKDNFLENPLRSTIDLTFLRSLENEYKLDTNYQKNITAIIYQIEPTLALEVVYRHSISEAIYKGDVKTLSELSMLDAFPHLLPKVATEITNQSILVNAIFSLPKKSKMSDELLRRIWKSIAASWNDIIIDNKQVANFQLLILQSLEEQERKNFLKRLTNRLITNNAKLSFEDLLNAIDGLRDFCNSNKMGYAPMDLIDPVIVEPNVLIDLVKLRKANYKEYKLECTESSLEEYLNSLSIDVLLDSEILIFGEFKFKRIYDRLNYRLFDVSLGEVFIMGIISVLNRRKEIKIPKHVYDENYLVLLQSFNHNKVLLAQILCLRLMDSRNCSASNEVQYKGIIINAGNAFLTELIFELRAMMTFSELLSFSFGNRFYLGVYLVSNFIDTIKVIVEKDIFDDYICILKSDLQFLESYSKYFQINMEQLADLIVFSQLENEISKMNSSLTDPFFIELQKVLKKR